MRGHNCFCQKSLSVCPIAASSTTVTYLEIAEHTFQMLICSITMGETPAKNPFSHGHGHSARGRSEPGVAGCQLVAVIGVIMDLYIPTLMVGLKRSCPGWTALFHSNVPRGFPGVSGSRNLECWNVLLFLKKGKYNFQMENRVWWWKVCPRKRSWTWSF